MSLGAAGYLDLLHVANFRDWRLRLASPHDAKNNGPARLHSSSWRSAVLYIVAHGTLVVSCCPVYMSVDVVLILCNILVATASVSLTPWTVVDGRGLKTYL